TDAVKKAKADAVSVATAMDVAIVGPVEISTTGSQFSPYRMYMGYDTGYRGLEVEALPMPTPAVAAPPQIQPGDVTVSAQVTVVYEFG
ncbi:MAG TPA: DUF541 domain-containing protein, partial [Methanosarcinales archaeon]|nr:DUF541 domain-containing protein [Methanosarcinales archaeon]